MNFDTPDAEDTAFYAQLTSQILLLMDEDDVTNTTRPQKDEPELEWKPVTGGSYGSRSLMNGAHFGWFDDGRSSAVNGWMGSLSAANGAGTGVFIPRVAVTATGKPRRKRHHKPRKNKNGGRLDSSEEQRIRGGI